MSAKWILPLIAIALPGCSPAIDLPDGEPTGVTADLAAKAVQVADQIGGDDGFGGSLMDDYHMHREDHMGFHHETDLADPDDHMLVELRNESNVDCTFHLAFVASYLGVDEQDTAVDVPAGHAATIQMACPEIFGLGSLTAVGDTAVEIMDGISLDNRMCVPGFLGADYQCTADAATFACIVMIDENDIDADGDTEELIALTQALQTHMGPRGHGHMMLTGR